MLLILTRMLFDNLAGSILPVRSGVFLPSTPLHHSGACLLCL